MSRFIQPLECRTLLTASPTSLAAELTAINNSAGTIKADLIALQAGAKADLKTIATDLKGSPKTNAPLAKKLSADETKLLAKIKADVALLLKAVPKSTKGAADGNATL